MKNALVETAGPFGGEGGDSWDDGVHTAVRKLIIFSSEVIESIQIEYDENGKSKWSNTYGRKEGKINTVVLDYPSEFLVSVSGYIAEYHTLVVINSLTLESNKRTYGPFGTQRGECFKFPPTTGNKIIGFHGSAGYHLDSIGAHFEPAIPCKPAEPPIPSIPVVERSSEVIIVEPFGYKDGNSWDDEDEDTVKELIVYSDRVLEFIQIEYEGNGQLKLSNTHATKEGTMITIELEYPYEFPISVLGYIGEVAIPSLTFESSKKRTLEPSSVEEEQDLEFPSTMEYKIVGFFGRSGCQIDAIGAYMEPKVPWIPVVPFGGQGGNLWDDGVHTTIRQLIIFYSEAISYIEVEYDDNGKSKWSNTRGHKQGTRGTVELDYPHEYINSVSGYIDLVASVKQIVSLTFESNRRTYGPFGKEQGEHFKFP
ncbi:hypothetical protein LguiB_004603 [Lonicera macranthoides]